jgi:hypothetical protein
MSKPAKGLLLFAALFLTLLSPCRSMAAQNSDDDIDDFADDTMNQRYDWVITADTTPMKNFLGYPGSGLHPVSKIKVNYRLTPRFGRERASYDPVAYEELWYHECKPIGCRKMHQLGLDAGQQGVIYFRPAKEVGDNHCAVANAIVRLILDACLKQAMVGGVFVPAEIFDQVKSDLGQFNFFPYEIQPDTGIRATMHIFLQSQPTGREASLFYFNN